jgi:hypothetical protein
VATERDLFEKQISEGCVVCGQTVPGGYFDSPKAILYLREECGPMQSVDAKTVLVHEACESRGKSIAGEQGYGWQFPLAPEWDDPKVKWTPPPSEA